MTGAGTQRYLVFIVLVLRYRYARTGKCVVKLGLEVGIEVGCLVVLSLQTPEAEPWSGLAEVTAACGCKNYSV